AGKSAILVVEEGQPEFIEQAVNTILRRADVQTRVEGKGMLPMAGEYTGGVGKEGLGKFVTSFRPDLVADEGGTPASSARLGGGGRRRRRGAPGRRKRSPATCTGARPRSAPAARSGRSLRR